MSEAPSTPNDVLSGYSQIIRAWAQLARHGERCPQCSEVVAALRKGYARPPIERLESLCAAGQGLAGTWTAACEAEHQRYLALKHPRIVL